MNFYAHAVVASWFRVEPEFVLGAMLPDLLSMIGKAPSSFSSLNRSLPDGSERTTELLAGVALHRATDAVFHELPEFSGLVARARAKLSALGLSRGAARAVAHIGVEMLLDEELVSDAPGQSAYFSALAYTQRAELPIPWTPGEELRFRELTAVLSRRGLPEIPSPPLELARRLRRVLAARPRLAFEADQERAVSDWVAEARPAVRASAPAILSALRSSLPSGAQAN